MVDTEIQDAPGLEAVYCTDDIIGAETLYQEELRPQFHFSPRRGWLNDPNGLVYYAGEYHLFFQHNPYGVGWDNMHWGHAVSPDLVHWQELPVALYPWTQAKGHCYSGSAVVDHDNTAGFQCGAEPALVAAFTDTESGEALAYSNDRGRTWTYAAGNPVLTHAESSRDPKVFWYGEGGHWVMAVYEVRDGGLGIAFYTSADLKCWQAQSWTPGYFECPDIFPLSVDGDKAQMVWVLCGADGDYQLGDFDGKAFTPTSPKLPFQYGNIYYAMQTYNDLPAEDGRRVQITWGQSHTPGMPFNQCMLSPVVLTLRQTLDGTRLCASPIQELEALHGAEYSYTALALPDAQTVIPKDILPDCLDIRLTCTPGYSSRITFILHGTKVVYNAVKQMLYCRDCAGPLKLQDGRFQLRLLRDRSTLEIFGNDGLLYMPVGIQPDPTDHSFSMQGDVYGTTIVDELTIYEMRSIWP